MEQMIETGHTAVNWPHPTRPLIRAEQEEGEETEFIEELKRKRRDKPESEQPAKDKDIEKDKPKSHPNA